MPGNSETSFSVNDSSCKPGVRKWGLAPSESGFVAVSGLPTVPVPFSDGECQAPWKKGTGTERPRFFTQFRPITARSQSPFSTTRLQFENQGEYRNRTPGHVWLFEGRDRFEMHGIRGREDEIPGSHVCILNRHDLPRRMTRASTLRIQGRLPRNVSDESSVLPTSHQSGAFLSDLAYTGLNPDPIFPYPAQDSSTGMRGHHTALAGVRPP